MTLGFVGPLNRREAIAAEATGKVFFTEPPAHQSVIEVGGDKVLVLYDPALPTLGLSGFAAYGDIQKHITLRQWNERVFLHELLHLLLGQHYPLGQRNYNGVWIEDPAHEKAVAAIEDGLWALGWRWIGDQR